VYEGGKVLNQKEMAVCVKLYPLFPQDIIIITRAFFSSLKQKKRDRGYM